MLDLIWSVLGFLVAISILVCFHEYGHYWMARRMGVKVLRFSLGWGKPFKTLRSRDGVEWSLAPYPVGGYVKLLDEREGPVAPHERHLAFNNQSVPRRMAILAAGPAFNFMLAVLLYWMVFVLGVQGLKPVVAQPPAQSAAALAGVAAGEQVIEVAGEPVVTWADLRTLLIDHALNAERLPLRLQDAAGSIRSVELDVSQVRVDPEYLFDDLGLEPFQPAIEPVLEEVSPGSAAEAAGFRKGDRLIAYDGKPIASWQDWAGWVQRHPGTVVRVQAERGGERFERNVVLGRMSEAPERGLFGARVQVSPELWQDLRAERRLDVVSALPAALHHTWQMSQLTVRMLWRMVLGDVSVKNVSGPIQIAQVAGDSAQVGLVSFLSFMAIVSVSLGVLNLLPVPLLDGGHLLLYAIEGIKGRPLSERALAASQYIGFAFIGTLMVLAFYNDIMRLI